MLYVFEIKVIWAYLIIYIRQDRIVSVTFGGSGGIVVDEVQRDPVDVNSIWLQVPEIANGKHRGAESGDRSKHR